MIEDGEYTLARGLVRQTRLAPLMASLMVLRSRWTLLRSSAAEPPRGFGKERWGGSRAFAC
jgi:hypothetical protein